MKEFKLEGSLLLTQVQCADLSCYIWEMVYNEMNYKLFTK